MTGVETLTAVVAGAVAYAACAGVARRLMGDAPAPKCYCNLYSSWEPAYECFRCAELRVKRLRDSRFWPLAGTRWIATKVVRAVHLPLRAVYRLTAGRIQR